MGRKKATLCGRQFDIVQQGLAEEQVAACLTELITQMKAMAERRDPLTSLCQTCEQMEGVLRETRTVLQSAREAAFKAVENEKQRIISEAYHKAQETQAQAQRSAQAIKEEAREALATARAEAESLLANANKQACELLAISSEKASATLQEVAERIQGDLVSKLKAQAEETLATRSKIESPPLAEVSADSKAEGTSQAQEGTTPAEQTSPDGEKAAGTQVYDRRVLLLVHSPRGDGAMKSFYQQLCTWQDMRILAERGSSQSMELTIELEKPMPLKEMLLGLPQVQKVTDEGLPQPRHWPWRSPKGSQLTGAKLHIELAVTSGPAQAAKTEEQSRPQG